MKETSSGRPLPADREVVDEGRFRRNAYQLCLAVSFSLYIFWHGLHHGVLFLFACLGVLVALILPAAAIGTEKRAERLQRLAAFAAAALSATVPVIGLIVAGQTLPAAASSLAVWPQVLVCLFASRLLAEMCEQRLTSFGRQPFRSGRPSTQSFAAAFLLGCAMMLLFCQSVGGIEIAPNRLDPTAIVLRALAGGTLLHVTIVLLFFVILAAILDAALLLRHNAAALDALRGLHAEQTPLGQAELARLAQLAPLHAPHLTRAMGVSREGEVFPTMEALHQASRRMIRALVSLLPLLGFLGTVIGLTAAMAGLPRTLGQGGGGEFDISASLLGLALKFETTLLGLAAALIASFLLALLDKHEEEVAAEYRYLSEALLARRSS